VSTNCALNWHPCVLEVYASPLCSYFSCRELPNDIQSTQNPLKSYMMTQLNDVERLRIEKETLQGY
jgi:hypothetical protein